MKVRIKSFNGELPKWLSLEKWYNVFRIESLTTVYIKDDYGFSILIQPNNCSYLNGGSWEIVNEND